MQEQSTLNTTLDLYRHPQFCNSAVGLFWHKAGSGDLAISASFFFRYPTAALRSPSRTAEKQAHPSGPIQVGSRMTRHAPRVPGDVVSTSSNNNHSVKMLLHLPGELGTSMTCTELGWESDSSEAIDGADIRSDPKAFWLSISSTSSSFSSSSSSS